MKLQVLTALGELKEAISVVIDLASQVMGILPVANGGTGASSLTGHGAVTVNSGGTALTTVAPGASGNVLTSNGTDWTSAAPTGGGGDSTVALAVNWFFS